MSKLGSRFGRVSWHKNFCRAANRQSGLKGQSIVAPGIERHSLVLENSGDATYQDVVHLMRHVQDTVLQRFGVSLTPEPHIFSIDL